MKLKIRQATLDDFNSINQLSQQLGYDTKETEIQLRLAKLVKERL